MVSISQLWEDIEWGREIPRRIKNFVIDCFLWLITHYHRQGELENKRFTWDYGAGPTVTSDNSRLPERCLNQHRTLYVCLRFSLTSYNTANIQLWSPYPDGPMLSKSPPLKASILNIIDWISILSMHHNGIQFQNASLSFQHGRASVYLGDRHITLALSLYQRDSPWFPGRVSKSFGSLAKSLSLDLNKHGIQPGHHFYQLWPTIKHKRPLRLSFPISVLLSL